MPTSLSCRPFLGPLTLMSCRWSSLQIRQVRASSQKAALVCPSVASWLEAILPKHSIGLVSIPLHENRTTAVLVHSWLLTCLFLTGILTPSLLPVKAAPSDFTDSPPMLEVQEFPLLESPEWLATCHAYLTFQHHFYVYPEYVKFDNQKQVMTECMCEGV